MDFKLAYFKKKFGYFYYTYLVWHVSVSNHLKDKH